MKMKLTILKNFMKDQVLVKNRNTKTLLRDDDNVKEDILNLYI